MATTPQVLVPGAAMACGDPSQPSVAVAEEIPAEHKLVLRGIVPGENIMKYDVVIGCATKEVKTGQWVHLHNMKSLYDARSSNLDVVAGMPTDTRYE